MKTPVKIEELSNGELIVKDAEGSVVIDCEWNGSASAFSDRGDAEKFVRAVNERDALLAAVQTLEDELKDELVRVPRRHWAAYANSLPSTSHLARQIKALVNLEAVRKAGAS